MLCWYFAGRLAVAAAAAAHARPARHHAHYHQREGGNARLSFEVKLGRPQGELQQDAYRAPHPGIGATRDCQGHVGVSRAEITAPSAKGQGHGHAVVWTVYVEFRV